MNRKGSVRDWVLAAVLAAAVLAAVLWRVAGAPGPSVLQTSDPDYFAGFATFSAQTEAPAAQTAAPTAAVTSTVPSSATAVPTEPSAEVPTAAPSPQLLPSADPAPTPAPAAECTLAIRCDKILENWSLLDPDKAELVPQDGVLLATTAFQWEEGESAFDLLLRACRQAGLHLEFSSAPLYGAVYIEGIGNLYEFDCGQRSGWLYHVNGQAPDQACSEYLVQEGDRVEFLYSCDWGDDLS